MGRWHFVAVVLGVAATLSCSPPPLVRVLAPQPLPDRSDPKGATLASFGDELGLSLEPSKLEDETTATEVYVFNRGSRTWTIVLDATDDLAAGRSGRSLSLEVHDTATPERLLPPMPIGLTEQCPRPPSRDVVVVGPGERGLVGCVEQLVDTRGVEELELSATLQFTAADGSAIHVQSPPFRVARRSKGGLGVAPPNAKALRRP